MRAEVRTTQYLSHGIDRWPAKLIPQIARYIVRTYSAEGDTVLDPFCGSGSILVEARLLGRDAIGIDVNPLATLYARVKARRYRRSELARAERLLWAKFERRKNDEPPPCTFPNHSLWFSRTALTELRQLRAAVEDCGREISGPERDFLLAALATIVRRCSRADPRGPKPFVSKRMRANERRPCRPVPAFRAALGTIGRSLMEVAGELENVEAGRVRVATRDARHVARIVGEHKVELVATSPPYINAQDYFRSSKLELWVLGLTNGKLAHDLGRQLIGSERVTSPEYANRKVLGVESVDRTVKRLFRVCPRRAYIVAKYFSDMKDVLDQIAAMIVPGGICCLVVGGSNICGVHIRTHAHLLTLARSAAFTPEAVLVDTIKARHVPPQRNHNRGMIRTERVLVLRRDA